MAVALAPPLPRPFERDEVLAAGERIGRMPALRDRLLAEADLTAMLGIAPMAAAEACGFDRGMIVMGAGEFVRPRDAHVVAAGIEARERGRALLVLTRADPAVMPLDVAVAEAAAGTIALAWSQLDPAPVADPTATVMANLTSRERTIVQRIAAGCSNREIAAELILSPETVKSHVSRVYRKLGVSSRAEAAARVAAAGWPAPRCTCSARAPA